MAKQPPIPQAVKDITEARDQLGGKLTRERVESAIVPFDSNGEEPPASELFGDKRQEESTQEAPEWIKRKKVSELTTVQPVQILRGVLYRACKLILMAGSKSFKTWALMDLAYCVGNGLP